MVLDRVPGAHGCRGKPKGRRGRDGRIGRDGRGWRHRRRDRTGTTVRTPELHAFVHRHERPGCRWHAASSGHRPLGQLQAGCQWSVVSGQWFVRATDNWNDWCRTACEEQVDIALPDQTKQPKVYDVPGSAGLRLAVSIRPVEDDAGQSGLPAGTRSVSIFLVNHRKPAPDETRDEAFAFQVQLELTFPKPLVPRPNVRSLGSSEWDERVADLQYRDVYEYAVGHNVATEAILGDGHCHRVRTCWVPQAEVERVAPAEITGVERSMDALAQLASADEARSSLGGFVAQYRQWIADQRTKTAADAATAEGDRRGTAASGRDRRRADRAGDCTAGRSPVPGRLQAGQSGDGQPRPGSGWA